MRFEARNQFNVYDANKSIESRGCNCIFFDNKGNVTALINGAYRVLPGQNLSINQVDAYGVDITQYYVEFRGADAASTGILNELHVITTFIEVVQSKSATAANCQKL